MFFLKKKNSKKVLNTNLKSIQHHKTIGKVLGASQVNQIKFFIQMCSKSNKLTIKGFWKIILYRGFTTSPIVIHKSSLWIPNLVWYWQTHTSLELFHLFGTISLDSCSTKNQISIKNKRVQTEWDIVAYFWKKRDFDPKDSKWIFEIDFH